MTPVHEPLLDYVLRRLDETKGAHRLLAAQSGVPYSTIAKIAQGITPNPGVLAVQRLADVLHASERLAGQRVGRTGKEVA